MDKDFTDCIEEILRSQNGIHCAHVAEYYSCRWKWAAVWFKNNTSAINVNCA